MKGSGTTFIIAIAIIGLVLGGIIISTPPQTPTNNESETSADVSEDPALVNRADAPRIGNENAKIKIVVFSDYLCPYCKTLHEKLNEILAANPDTVSLTSRTFLIHPQADILHRAAEAANKQGKFKEMNDELFKAGEDPTESEVIDMANKIKLNINQFKSDLNSDAAKSAVAGDDETAKQLGLGGTPSVYINGKYIDDPSNIESIINSELGK